MLSRKPSLDSILSYRKINKLIPFTNAPLFHALQLLATGDAARFHMPGHKGVPVFSTFGEVFTIDFTETPGTGNLYLGEGCIRDAEVAAALYFSAEDCFFLTGGSSQGVMAMLATAVGKGGGVLLDRECHKSVCHTCALLDITPYFVTAPLLEPFGISGALPLEEIRRKLASHPDIKAVFVTSPTYYGVCRNIPALAELCRAYGKLLLVDAAHGAHFKATGLSAPVAEGADIAVLSVHKTLPCMGQGAVLIMGAGVDKHSLRENTSVFGTSSPSYPIMASIDLARAYMEGPGREAYQRSAMSCAAIRRYVQSETRFTALTPEDFPALDPCRLTICAAGTDITGSQLGSALWAQYGVACEMTDQRNTVFILTGLDSRYSLKRLRHAIKGVSRLRSCKTIPDPSAPFPHPERVMRVREAWFSPVERVPLEDAEGKVCARPVTPYPPGVPLIWPGEKITPEHVALIRERWYNKSVGIDVVVSERKGKLL